nr:peptidoglycan-associated lipoprotein [Pseudomonadota bacterium]
MKNKLIGAIAIAAALATAGCASRNRDLPPEPPSASTPGEGELGTEEGAGAGAVTPGSRADFLQSVPTDRVLFAFDSFSLDGEARATLDAQAQWLNSHPNVRV